MKVINGIITVLTILLVAQSFLTACPTCLDELKNKDHNLVGEVEITPSKKAQSMNDQFHQQVSRINVKSDQTESQINGFTTYDKTILGRLKNGS